MEQFQILDFTRYDDELSGAVVAFNFLDAGGIGQRVEAQLRVKVPVDITIAQLEELLLAAAVKQMSRAQALAENKTAQQLRGLPRLD